MCGIAGFIDKNAKLDPRRYMTIVTAMSSTLAHRGPDGAGSWIDENAGLTLGNRRLAIIDLTKAADQPMVSSCGRFVLTYNGEIYNAPELRDELRAAGRRFRGHSDTEVLLEACASWGIHATLSRLDGMFAFALWDRKEKALYLARDRLGIKPLYWADSTDRFLFGSELKALRAFPGWSPEILPGAVAAYFRHSYIPAPYSIYAGVEKLDPGTLLTVRNGKVSRQRYWDLRSQMAANEPPAAACREEALEQLEPLLHQSVEWQMRSDVPVGILLSGGIDSTVLSALAREHAGQSLKTFSLGFDAPSHDETPYAEAVAKALGTQHESICISDADVTDIVPRLPVMFDEPFADSSQIPTAFLCARIRESVTVALSGEGGDELFAGYDRYFMTRLNAVIDALPHGARHALARIIETVPPQHWGMLASMLPRRWRPHSGGTRAHFLAGMLRDCSDVSYRRLVSHWHNPQDLLPDANEVSSPVWSDPALLPHDDSLKAIQLIDILTYLPDDLLVKMDRASMAASLEVRVPFLNHNLVEWCMRLPKSVRIDRNSSKWMLRSIAQKYVPRELIERPKMGFACPIGEWLRGPLRDWAESLLGEKHLAQDGLLNPRPIREKWRQHLERHADWQYHLWIALQYLEWRRANTA